jgi:orotate phosphoribosyltransferase
MESDLRALSAEIYRRAHLTGEFTLRSGRVAHDYFDKYRFETDPRLLRTIAHELARLLPPADALAGLELGGVPLATVLSQVTGLPARFVRKQAKAYGTQRLAEGGEVRGLRLVIVEDVATTGGQILASAHALRNAGAIIRHALVVIDREQGAAQNLREAGVELHALLTVRELEANLGDALDGR